MTNAKLVFNKGANTLDIWFGNHKKEAINEETSDEMILKKDKNGKVIGIEILNFIKAKKVPKGPTIPAHQAKSKAPLHL
ncbi:MAG: DUF2283 domain-containing protein [Candidatus Micrarchaeota archaeon]|nr:DUF2283 domain-containing protein [Candidatus Micrarchaeota archaeon]MDE1847547.1 DUF2283 domain-containing protein [Candidatus Micrarchaeota archaeon]MDE1864264.1 DUF2283 domain-containing protein [Candidatus Micrarchaeota archaeon]